MNDAIEPIETEITQRKALQFDWRDHTDLLENQELSEDEQREFLETLWSIMVHFVDFGFDLNAFQLLNEQEDKSRFFSPEDMLSLPHTKKTQITPQISADFNSLQLSDDVDSRKK